MEGIEKKNENQFYLVSPWVSYINSHSKEDRKKRKEKERCGEDQDLRVAGFVKCTEQEHVTKQKQRWRGTSTQCIQDAHHEVHK